jgi:FO synthase subunit 2
MTIPLLNLLADVKAGHRMTDEEALSLFSVRDRQIWDVARTADEVREERAGPAATWVRNQNINVTNLCVNACGFCGFSKKPGDEGIYFHDKGEIQKKAALAKTSSPSRSRCPESGPCWSTPAVTPSTR